MKHVIITLPRGDAPRLVEWITYHERLGFDEFHIILDNPTDNSAEILRNLRKQIKVNELMFSSKSWNTAKEEHSQRLIAARSAHQSFESNTWGGPNDAPRDVLYEQYIPGVLNNYALEGNCWVAVLSVEEFICIPSKSIKEITAEAESSYLIFQAVNFDTTSWSPGESVLSTCVKRWHQDDLITYTGSKYSNSRSIARHDRLLPFVSTRKDTPEPSRTVSFETARIHRYQSSNHTNPPLPYRVVDTTLASEGVPFIGAIKNKNYYDSIEVMTSEIADLRKVVQKLQPRAHAWIPEFATIGSDCDIAKDVALVCRENTPIVMGDKVRVYRGTEILGPVTIGSNVLINRDAYIRPNVRIADGVFLGPFVRLITDSHEIGGPQQRAGKNTCNLINIGHGTWVGASTTVLGGVTIGEGCVIAAGSLVNKDIPDNTIYGGVPARPIRKILK